MIDYIHQMANEWGHWMRKSEAKQGAIQGTLGRIHAEGPVGAAIRALRDHIPVVDFPEDIAEFHRAWKKLDDEYSDIIYVDYKMRKPVKEKFKIIGKKKDAYYRLRSAALAAVMYRMAVE